MHLNSRYKSAIIKLNKIDESLSPCANPVYCPTLFGWNSSSRICWMLIFSTDCFVSSIFLSTLCSYLHYVPIYIMFLSTLCSYLHYVRIHLIFLYTNSYLNLHKVNFNSAQQLFNSIVFTASTYRLETYVDELFEIEIKQHYRKTKAVFWKSWCGVSKYTSTTTLFNRLMFHDIHGLKDCPPKHRRIIAKFFANGLHNNFCCMEGCYQWEENLCVQILRKNSLISRSCSLL